MVKAFKDDAAALRALKRWAKDRPGAFVSIEAHARGYDVKLHLLAWFCAGTLRAAARLALSDFEKRSNAAPHKTLSDHALSDLEKRSPRKAPSDRALGLGA